MIIGLSAVARGGKDTAGGWLRVKHGVEVKHFAGPMKEMLLLAFPKWGREHVHGALKDSVCPHYQVSPRHALQTLGTDWGRALGDTVWIRATMETLEPGRRYAICDVRFPNEVEAIQAAGGKVIRLTRGEQALRHAVHSFTPPHESETALLDYNGFDAVIDNRSTTLEQFRCELLDTVAGWL